MALATRPSSVTEIYGVSETSVSAERRLSTVSENGKKERPPPECDGLV
jgi:hypothetical protein